MSKQEFTLRLADESATVDFGKRLGQCFRNGGRLYLHGDLGAGKTTLSRGILRSFGHKGAVKSPTFTIVEPYELPDISIYHFDLYRLADANELEYIGIDDYFEAGNLCLVEWPERAADTLPQCDMQIVLDIVDRERQIRLVPVSELGADAVAQLASKSGVL
jgi:tRNA threonylcarbamoyladenosine biosynthesis protein TsaE